MSLSVVRLDLGLSVFGGGSVGAPPCESAASFHALILYVCAFRFRV